MSTPFRMFRLVYDIFYIIGHATWNQALFYCALLSLLPAYCILFDSGLLGFEGAEAYGHAWAYWWRSESFPLWPKGTELANGTLSWPAIDPLPTALCVLLSQVVGTMWAYNIWVLLSRYLLALGGWLLAKRVNGSPQAGASLALFFPPFIGVQYSGLTEDFGLGVVLIGFSYLLDEKQRSLIIGGIFLGLVPWCGLVLGWYTALLAIIVGVVLLYRMKGPKRIWLILSGVLSMVIGGLSALPHLSRLGGAGHRYGVFEYGFEPLWTLNPVKYIDLLSLIAPIKQSFEGMILRVHPGYLGVCVLLAAVLGSKGNKRWWLLLLFIISIAVGPELFWKGEPIGLGNPFWPILSGLPGFELMNHYGRALLLASVPLVILAARGARHWAIHLMIILDLLFLGPLSPVLPISASPSLPSLEYLETLPEGGIVILPASGPNIHPQKPLWDQRQHGRKIWLSPNRLGLPAALMPIDSIRELAEDPTHFNAETTAFPCFVAAILVRRFFAEPYLDVLGEPDIQDAQFLVWSRQRISPHTNCAI